MIFSREGFKALRFIYGVTLAGFAVAIFLAVGSYWYWQAEKKSNQQSQRSLQDLQGRVNGLRLEREDLRNSDSTYLMLISRGAFIAEQRVELIEAIEALRSRHRLASLEYEVAPQRVLRMADAQSLPAIDVLGSRIRFKIRAYHDGDLMAFLDEFPRMQRGFFPLDRCAIRRSLETTRQPVAQATAAAAAAKDGSPAIEAECIADWVTLADKSKPRQAQSDLSFSSRS